MKAPAETHECTGLERSEVQRLVIEHPAGLRIPGLQDLKAAVEQEPVLSVGSDSPANVIFGIQEEGVQPPLLEGQRAGQTGKTGSDDDYFGSHVSSFFAR